MSEDNGVWIVKLVSIILFFFIAAISGTIPIIMKKFRSNQKLLAFSSAFSGGLFLGVGLLHLLPEANIMIDSAIKEDDEEAYPFAYLITIISFSLILFIEKVAAENIHQHYYKDPVKIQDNKQKLLEEQDRLNKGEKIESVYQTENENNDQQIRQTLNTQRHLASIVSNQNSQISVSDSCQIDKSKSNKMAPFILQVAVGIHAVFEGLSIGIQEEVSLCLGVAIAVACHKWAEGFTLGSSFRTAGVNKQIAIPMILLQSTLNPIGIIIGWILAQEGDLVSGIFLSVSVGTFLYISTLEILVEEFSVSRYKFQKYCVYVAALMFVGSFWFIEKLLQVE